MRTSQETSEIFAALVAAQGEMPAVPKTATNPHFGSKFAPLDAIVKTTQPILKKHNLAVLQGGSDMLDEHGRICVTTRIIHKSGQWVEDGITMRPMKDDCQGVGAAITYGSRYGYRLLGVCTDDDTDGEDAVDHSKPAPKPKSKPKKAKEQPAKPKQKGQFAFLKVVKGLKAQLADDEAYYELCSQHGVKHANKISTRDAQKAFYADLGKLVEQRTDERNKQSDAEFDEALPGLESGASDAKA